MASNKAKRFKAVKKGHTWIWVIVFIIIFMISTIVMSFSISAVLGSLLNGKIESEYETAMAIGLIYSRGDSMDIDTMELLKGFSRDFIVTDKDGNIIDVCGNNTCDLENGRINGIELGTSSRIAVVDLEIGDTSPWYADTVDRTVVSGNNGVFRLDIFSIIDRVAQKYSDLGSGSIPTAEEEEEYFYSLVSEMDQIRFPFWISVPITEERNLICKIYISMNINDVGLMIGAIASLAILMLIIFTIMLVNIISGLLRRRKTMKVFFTDAVTQGHNFMYFIIRGGERLRKLSAHSTRYAVIDLMFVNYRTFCVCHSVEEGEKVLCKVYELINANIDSNREMCAHTGSAEFAVLMRFTDEQALKRRIETLTEQLAVIDSDHVFAFHAGVAIVEPDGTPGKDGVPVRRKDLDMETVYNNAGTARATLEASDDSGVAFFDNKLVDDQKWIDAVQEHQRSAIENEEFMVYYQPKYDPSNDQLRGAEALIRWQSPEFGFVPPGRIIPIFEKNGFITEIDHYMISHVAKDQKMWLDMGLKCVPVSVNVSRAHFIESDLAEQIRDMVDAAGCPHDLIEIELTESAFFDDKKAMINTIMKLKSYGFAVSMDDFGSGYSSLNSLKDMPLDVLKLDAEFFRGENGDGRGEIVVTEAIRLAKSLNMRTVAEGVEVREQVDFLASQGCDMIQGYYYAKPMPKSDYEQRMKPQGA